MKKLTRPSANIPAAPPPRILQFGGGNFLRGFVDWMVDVFNEKTGAQLGVVVVKPTASGSYEKWASQNGLYHLRTRGLRGGAVVDETRLVTCIHSTINPYDDWAAFLKTAEEPGLRFIVSNTTEVGLRNSPADRFADAPPAGFPAKLTCWLHRRFEHFGGDGAAGCILLPCELLEKNGDLLRRLVLENAGRWQLGDGFRDWLAAHCIFCNTLVDRIVPGLAGEALEAFQSDIGYRDEMATEGEPYHGWAIEAPAQVRHELPLGQAGLNVVFTDDLSPFRTLKVRILNGAHTAMVPVGYLAGLETVGEVMANERLSRFVNSLIFNEIIPTLGLPQAGSVRFANEVLDRFRNPYVRHRLLTISLQSVSKWRVRLLPTLAGFFGQNGRLPERVVFSLAALVWFYRGGPSTSAWFQTTPTLKSWQPNDEPEVVAFFKNEWAAWAVSNDFDRLAVNILRSEKCWGTDLAGQFEGLAVRVSFYLKEIAESGVALALERNGL